MAAARLSVHRGDVEDAKAYYHRAIYGNWPHDARTHRVATRLELPACWIRQAPRRNCSLNCCPWSLEVQGNPAEGKHVAALYLDATRPRGPRLRIESLIAADPNDSEVYAGLGEAELALAD